MKKCLNKRQAFWSLRERYLCSLHEVIFMSNWLRALIVTIVFAVIALLLTPILWPFDPWMSPPEALMPFFLFVSLVEALVFGIGIAFIAYALPRVKFLKEKYQARAFWSAISVAWLLVSWWPHDNFHRFIGMDASKLIYLEFGFHLTVILASLIIAYTLVTLAQEKAWLSKLH